MVKGKRKVLCVVPAFNESLSIQFVKNDLEKSRMNFVLIDDGSTDQTYSLAKRLSINVLRHPFNMGIGATIQTGFKYAIEHGISVVIQYDGDFQHRADQIPNILLPVLKNECDIAIGSRVLEGSYRFPFFRRLGSKWFSHLIWCLTGVRITDPTSGFRAYGKNAIKLFAKYYPEDFPEVEAIMLAYKKRLKIIEVPAKMRYRLKGESSINFANSIYYMLKVTLALLVRFLQK